jgi:hypothetical protein
MFRKDYWVTCDQCGDTAWCDGQTQRDAASYARTQGWSIGKNHLCPVCKEKPKRHTKVSSRG